MADPIRDAAERLLQQLELRRTDPDVPLALERAENDLRAALAAQPAPEVEPDPLQAALEKIRNAAEQASAAFKPLAELLNSLAAALPPDGPAVPEGREPAAGEEGA